MFKSIKSQKAPQQIVQQIRAAILSGKIAPGEKLNSEKDLVAGFGVSKATMRESIRVLEFLGLVEVRKGVNGGIFASEVDIEVTKESLINFLHFKNTSVYHLSEIRKVLEPYAARVAAQAMTDQDIQKLFEINETCKHALAEGNIATIRTYQVKFHRAVAESTCNPALIFILTFIEDLLEKIKVRLKPDTEFFESVISAHDAIYEALRKRDPEKAFEEMYRDVSDVEESLSRMESLANAKVSGGK